MANPRLTDELKFRTPAGTFHQCQLCGYENTDICSFLMWVECDDRDKPEPGNVFILCRPETNPECQKRLNDHPRLYHLVPWGQGGPGHFMLLCGDCPHREGTGCKHPNLKANGGDGLLVNFAQSLMANVTVCFHDENGDHHCQPGLFPTPASACEGHPTEKPRKEDQP